MGEYKEQTFRGFAGGSVVKRLPAVQETRVRSLVQDDPMGRRAHKPQLRACAREPGTTTASRPPQLLSPCALEPTLTTMGGAAARLQQWPGRNWRKAPAAAESYRPINKGILLEIIKKNRFLKNNHNASLVL